MNCTRCRHNGKVTPITKLDKRGRKWCTTCQFDADWIANCQGNYASHVAQIRAMGLADEDDDLDRIEMHIEAAKAERAREVSF